MACAHLGSPPRERNQLARASDGTPRSNASVAEVGAVKGQIRAAVPGDTTWQVVEQKEPQAFAMLEIEARGGGRPGLWQSSIESLTRAAG